MVGLWLGIKDGIALGETDEGASIGCLADCSLVGSGVNFSVSADVDCAGATC